MAQSHVTLATVKLGREYIPPGVTLDGLSEADAAHLIERGGVKAVPAVAPPAPAADANPAPAPAEAPTKTSKGGAKTAAA